ncbi:hypothetical protein [Solidesulfovibrio sp.]
MSNPLGIVIHFEAGNGATNYLGWPFNSMAKIGGTYFGAGPDGLYEIGGDDDAGAQIDAVVETPAFDAGARSQKRVRRIYLGGQFSGDLTLYTRDDDANEREYTVPAPDSDRQQSVRVPVGRDGKGCYWQVGLRNEGGADFALDAMDIDFLILARRP